MVEYSVSEYLSRIAAVRICRFGKVGFLYRVVEPCIRKFSSLSIIWLVCPQKNISSANENTQCRIQNTEGRRQNSGGYLWRRINSMFADRNLAPFMFVSAATCRSVLGRQRRRWEYVEG